MNRPIVLYIAGIGRSGSTVLADILGSLPGAISIGELHHFWERGVCENWMCADGRLFHDHPVWRAALGAARRADPDLSDVERLKRNRRLRAARHKLARYVPKRMQFDVISYIREFEYIYLSLETETGSSILVDSGKVPFHAALLQTSRNIDFRVLHLLRDPRAVAFARSFEKSSFGARGRPMQMRRFSKTYSALRWIKRNHEARLLSLGGPYTRLSYSEFVTEPVDSVERVARELSLPTDLSSLNKIQTGGVSRSDKLSFSGNPNRLIGDAKLQLKNDESWKQGLSKFESAMIRFMCMPALQRFGPC